MIAITEPATRSYVPDLVRRWPVDEPQYRRVEGSLVSADISGFTALSERLAAHIDVLHGGVDPWDRWRRWVAEATATR